MAESSPIAGTPSTKDEETEGIATITMAIGNISLVSKYTTTWAMSCNAFITKSYLAWTFNIFLEV